MLDNYRLADQANQPLVHRNHNDEHLTLFRVSWWNHRPSSAYRWFSFKHCCYGTSWCLKFLSQFFPEVFGSAHNPIVGGLFPCKSKQHLTNSCMTKFLQVAPWILVAARISPLHYTRHTQVFYKGQSNSWMFAALATGSHSLRLRWAENEPYEGDKGLAWEAASCFLLEKKERHFRMITILVYVTESCSEKRLDGI